jgi:predicted kinase
VFALPLEVCLARNLARGKPRPPASIRRQHRWLVESLATLPDDEVAATWILRSEGEVDAVRVERLTPT